MNSAEFSLADDGIAYLRLVGAPEPQHVRVVTEAALERADRVEAEITDRDRSNRRALQLAGFRLEGRRRRATRNVDDDVSDRLIYGRLRDDLDSGEAGFSSVMNSVLPRTRTIAHVLFHRNSGEQREYLFCKTVFKADWELPGGVVEAHESPLTGATREVAEELGLEVQLGRLLAVDWLPPYLGWDDAVELIFDGGELSPDQQASMILQPSEIESVYWRTAAEASAELRPSAARRLQHIQHDPERTWYLEDGNVVGND